MENNDGPPGTRTLGGSFRRRGTPSRRAPRISTRMLHGNADATLRRASREGARGSGPDDGRGNLPAHARAMCQRQPERDRCPFHAISKLRFKMPHVHMRPCAPRRVASARRSGAQTGRKIAGSEPRLERRRPPRRRSSRGSAAPMPPGCGASRRPRVSVGLRCSRRSGKTGRAEFGWATRSVLTAPVPPGGAAKPKSRLRWV